MICWFCGKIEENPQKSLKLSMYGEVDSKTSDTLTKVAYNVRKIEVPRCESCNSRHSIASLGSFFGLILLAVLLIAIITTIFVFSDANAFPLGLIIGSAFGLAIAGFLVKVSVLKGIKTVHNAKTYFPEVKELLIKNYKFGVKPKDYVKESQKEEPKEKLDASSGEESGNS